MNHPRTTILGVVVVLCGLGSALNAYLDGNPATMPDWTLIGAVMTSGLSSIFSADGRALKKHLAECHPE